MEPKFETIMKEIQPKGKGYLVIRACLLSELEGLVRRESERLFRAGAKQVYVASTDPAAELSEVTGLSHVYDMLGMYRDLGPDRPRPAGQLTLEPLSQETGKDYLKLLNESFFAVPSSATNDEEDLKAFLEGSYRCGFALLDEVRVGVYECGFKKEFPEIGSLGLEAAFRGRGLGRELLLTVMDFLADLGHARCWLQVATNNAEAYPLYQSVGFMQDKVLVRWYEAMNG